MSHNRYIDGEKVVNTDDTPDLLEWQPSGRAGSFSIPAVQSDGGKPPNFGDAKKLRMNTSTFVPQISESAPAGTLQLSRQGAASWKEPVVAFSGRPVPSAADDSVELAVDLRDYTEACVIHEYNGRMEVNPWFSLIPMRNDQGGWTDNDGNLVANNDRSDHASVYRADNGEAFDLRQYSSTGKTSMIAAMGPDIIFIQPRAPEPDDEDDYNQGDWDNRVEAAGHQKMSFRGILVRYWVSAPRDNDPHHRIPNYYRVAERGENGKGLDDLRYILVR